MPLRLCCGNFLFEKETYQRVLFVIVVVSLLGGLIGAALSLHLSASHVTSFKLRYATINDGVVKPYSLISTRPVYVYSPSDLTMIGTDLFRTLGCENDGGKARISTVPLARGTNELVVSISSQKEGLGCADALAIAIVNDQNRRLAEYTDIWVQEQKILQKHYEETAEREYRNSRAGQHSSDRIIATAVVFEELYRVKWLIFSSREAVILAPPSSNWRRPLSKLLTYGLYGLIIACASCIIVFFIFWLMLMRQRRNQSSKGPK